MLADFPEDAPASTSTEDSEGAACAVSFASNSPSATLTDSVIDEIAELRMWHELAVRRRARTALGVARVPLEDLVRFISAWAEGARQASFREGLDTADALRLACEEIKTFYSEARMAQPGSHSSTTVRSWFWEETAAGRLLIRLEAGIYNDGDSAIRDFARNSLIPRAVRHAQA